MKWFVLFCAVGLTAYLAERYGYERGLSDAPDINAAKQELELERLKRTEEYLRSQVENPSPEICLAIVADGKVDFGSFCSDYFKKLDEDRYGGEDHGPSQFE